MRNPNRFPRGRLERYNALALKNPRRMLLNARLVLSGAAMAGVLLSGCDQHTPKKPDPAKGVVSGVVICADTAKPARFASVTLSAAPRADEKLEDKNPLPENETAVTDLDGRFRMEAVEPGHYYAFATQEGYLDPLRGLDFYKLESLENDSLRNREAIAEWKDHLVEVRVARSRVSETSLTIERAAEIAGTVGFDDGTPAIGMHFRLFRKTEKGETEVGLPLFDNWTTRTVSDGRGRFALTNLSAGEYTVCALMPAASEQTAAQFCLGNVPRRKDAKTVKVGAGELAAGVEIVLPLSGLHRVAGQVTALADQSAVGKATVRLLWADDREKARETILDNEGAFSFAFVPEGKFMVQVTGAQQAAEKEKGAATGEAAPKPIRFADKEIPLALEDDAEDLRIQLTPVVDVEKKP